MSTIALLGALDTKGAEYAFVRQCLQQRGHQTLLDRCRRAGSTRDRAGCDARRSGRGGG